MTTKSGKAKTAGAAKTSKAAPKRPAKAATKGHPAPKAAEKKPAAATKPAKTPAPKAPAKPAAAKGVAAKPAPAKGPAPKPAVAKKGTKAPAKRVRQREYDDLRKALVERQRELVRAYTISKGDSRAHPDSGTEDYIDYAVSSYTKEFVLSLSEMDRKQLVMVEEALARIERGEYGHCQQCGEEVPRKRLEVAPWVRYCVRCQGLEEQGLLPQYPSRLDADDRDDDESEDSAPVDFEGEAAVEEEEEIEEEPLVVDDEAEDLDED